MYIFTNKRNLSKALSVPGINIKLYVYCKDKDIEEVTNEIRQSNHFYKIKELMVTDEKESDVFSDVCDYWEKNEIFLISLTKKETQIVLGKLCNFLMEICIPPEDIVKSFHINNDMYEKLTGDMYFTRKRAERKFGKKLFKEMTDAVHFSGYDIHKVSDLIKSLCSDEDSMKFYGLLKVLTTHNLEVEKCDFLFMLKVFEIKSDNKDMLYEYYNDCLEHSDYEFDV